MKSKDYLKARGSGCSITIDAAPGASKTEIVGVNRWRGALQVKIAAEPRKGAANDELVRFISEKLSIPKTTVMIWRGEKSSHKVVNVPLPVAEVESILRGK